MKQRLELVDLDRIHEHGCGYEAHRIDLGSLEYLARSIEEDGLLRPPIVWRTNRKAAPFVVVDGRRCIAAIRLLRDRWSGPGAFPLQQLQCSVVEGPLQQVSWLTARLRLDPDICMDSNRGDDAVLCERIRTGEGWKQEELEAALGISQAWISNSKGYVQLLSAAALTCLRNGQITKADADKLVAMRTDPSSAKRADKAQQAAELSAMVAARDADKKRRVARRPA